MNSRCTILHALLCLGFCCIGSSLSPKLSFAQTFQVGFGRQDITPTEPVRLSGYASRSKPTSEIADRLFVRAMALTPDQEQDEQSVLILSIDTICVTEELTSRLAAWTLENHGIGRDQVVLCATHSHSTPHLSSGLSNLFNTPLTQDEADASRRYTELLFAGMQTSVEQALARRKPATIEVADTNLSFGVNRRLLRSGKWSGFGNQPDGKTDQRLRVMLVKDRNAQLLGGAYLYACHCTTLGANDRVSGDWAGISAQRFRKTSVRRNLPSNNRLRR